jgi:hypothetical protein
MYKNGLVNIIYIILCYLYCILINKTYGIIDLTCLFSKKYNLLDFLFIIFVIILINNEDGHNIKIIYVILALVLVLQS